MATTTGGKVEFQLNIAGTGGLKALHQTGTLGHGNQDGAKTAKKLLEVRAGILAHGRASMFA